MRRNKHKLTGSIGMGHRGYVLAPLSPLSSMRRPRVAAPLDLNALLGQLGRWPAYGTGAAQSYQATGTPSNGTTHDTPVWVPGDFPKGAPDVCDLTGQVAGCIDFGTGGAKGATIGGTGWDMAGLNALGLGKLQLGPAHTIVLFHKFDAAVFPGAYGGLALAAGGNAWFIHKVSTDFRLDWFQGTDRQRSSGSDLTGDNHWHMYHLRFRGDAALDMGVDGVPTFGPTIIAGVTGFNILSLGALTGTPYGVGRMCLARYFNRRVSDTELQTMAAGGQPDFPPDVVYLLDQTSGATVPDSAQVWTPGSVVSTIPDTSGHANDLVRPFNPGNLASLVARYSASGALTGGATQFTAASSQYYAALTSRSLKPVGTAGHCIGAVVRLTSKSADQGIAGICGATANAAGVSYYLGYETSADRFVFKASDGANLGSVSATTLGSPALNTAYSVIGWWDAAGTLKISVNAQATPDSAAWAHTPQSTADDFRIGRIAGNYADAKIEKCFVLQRTPTDAERTALWNAGAPPRFADAPSSVRTDALLGAWWDLGIVNAGDAAADSVALKNSNPGTLGGAAAFSGNHVVFDGSANTWVTIPSLVTNPRGDQNGEGTNKTGGSTILFRVKRTHTGNAYELLFGPGNAASGIFLNTGKIDLYSAGDNFGTTVLANGTEYDFMLRQGGDLRAQMWLGANLEKEFVPAAQSFTWDRIGGAAGYVSTSEMRDFLYVPWEVTDAEYATWRATGTLPAATIKKQSDFPETARRYAFGEGSGTLANDTAPIGNTLTATNGPTPADGVVSGLTAAGGDPVRALTNTVGGAAAAPSAGKRPAYQTASSADPLLPLDGMATAVRFTDDGSHNLQQSGLTGSSVTAFTAALSGRVFRQYQPASSTRDIPIYVLGASKDGNYPATGTDASSYIAAGYLVGGDFGPNPPVPWGLLLTVKKAGSAPLRLVVGLDAGVQPDEFAHDWMFEFNGGATAAARYIRIRQGGVLVGEITGASVPDALDLSGALELGSVASGATGASSFDLLDAWIYAAAHGSHGADFSAYFAANGLTTWATTWSNAIPGGINSGVNPDGWLVGSCIEIAANGDFIYATSSAGVDANGEDFQVQMSISPAASAGAPGTWGAPFIPHATLARQSPLKKFVTASVTRLVSGRLFMLSYWSPDNSPGNPPDHWELHGYYSDGNGAPGTWNHIGVIAPPAAYSTFGLGMHGKAWEVGSDIYFLADGKRNSDGHWCEIILKSADGGATVTLVQDIDAIGPGTHTQGTEGWLLRLDANNWVQFTRQISDKLALRFTKDAGATWSYYTLVGRTTNGTANAAVAAYLCQDGKILLAVSNRSTFGEDIRFGVGILVSTDGGRHFSAWRRMQTGFRGIGYPDWVRLPDGAGGVERVGLAFSTDISDGVLWQGPVSALTGYGA